MRFNRTNLEDCHDAGGVVVVIDVLRAFTTAAYAFNAGAEAMYIVSTLEQARAIKRRSPDVIQIGENHGRKPEDFEFGNSPQALVGRNLNGTTLVQRTTAGTQGVVRSEAADSLFAASLCCARATTNAINALDPELVTFVLTGVYRGGFGDEDAACADYLQALLSEQEIDVGLIQARVRNSGWGRRFGDPQYPFLDMRDLELCLQVDRFPFAMRVRTEGGLCVMRPEFTLTPSND
ncbi:MAG: 2-phosphosulfolactate phosphatase [Anaerolineales bacterium]|jgi:2-phosphosulfolactate phosphatase